LPLERSTVNKAGGGILTSFPFGSELALEGKPQALVLFGFSLPF
jgi:hypothetical protein